MIIAIIIIIIIITLPQRNALQKTIICSSDQKAAALIKENDLKNSYFCRILTYQ